MRVLLLTKYFMFVLAGSQRQRKDYNMRERAEWRYARLRISYSRLLYTILLYLN